MPKISCPRCGKPLVYNKIRDVPTFPFCSRRCKLIDLGRWLDERHRIPGPPVEENEYGVPLKDKENSGA